MPPTGSGNPFKKTEDLANTALQGIKDALGALRATAAGTLNPLFTLNEALKSTGTAIASSARIAAEGATQLASAFTEVGKTAAVTAGLINAPMLTLEAGIAAVNVEVARFVKLAAPGVFQRFQLAIDDLYASIGRALIPVLEKATEIFRAIGGAIFGLSGTGAKVIQAIAAATVGLVVFSAVTVAMVTTLGVGAAAITAFAGAAEIVIGVFTAGLGPLITAIVGGLAGALTSLIPIFAGVSAAVGGIILVTSDLQPILNKLATAFSTAFEAIGKALSAFTGSDILGPVLDLFANTLKGFATVIGAVVTALAPGLATMLQAFVKLAPAILAVSAAIAAIGFAPLIAMFSPLIVLFSAAAAAGWLLVKAFEYLKPAIDAVTSVLADTFGEVIQLFGDTAKAIGALISNAIGLNDLKSSFIQFSAYIAVLANEIGSFIKRIIDWIRDLFGIQRTADEPDAAPASNFGAAAKGTSTSDPSSVLRKARESAYSLGGGSSTAPERTASNTDAIKAAMAEAKGVIAGIKTDIEALPEKVGVYINAAATAIVAVFSPLKGALNPGTVVKEFKKDAGKAVDVISDTAKDQIKGLLPNGVYDKVTGIFG